MKDQPSPTEDEHSLAFGLTPKPGGNPPSIPPDYLYDAELDVYLNPRNPDRFMPAPKPSNNPPGIPPEFIYDEKHGGYIAPGEPSGYFDVEAWMREFREEMDNLPEEERRKGLITVDQLRAAGALDVPAAWRKSLGGGKERDLFSDLVDDDAPGPEKQQSPRTDADRAGPANEHQ